MKLNLRLLAASNVVNPVVYDLPIVFTGTRSECEKYAKDNGYTWEKDKCVFKGYYTHKNGNCLFLSI